MSQSLYYFLVSSSYKTELMFFSQAPRQLWVSLVSFLNVFGAKIVKKINRKATNLFVSMIISAEKNEDDERSWKEKVDDAFIVSELKVVNGLKKLISSLSRAIVTELLFNLCLKEIYEELFDKLKVFSLILFAYFAFRK